LFKIIINTLKLSDEIQVLTRKIILTHWNFLKLIIIVVIEKTLRRK